MTKTIEQNGRQQFVSESAATPTESGTRNASTEEGTSENDSISRPHTRSQHNKEEEDSICRDYIWGICTKGARCLYRHVRDIEYMKTTLKFCHDYQNKTGCQRKDCTYLHTSRDEQKLFLDFGKIPKILRERYDTMNNLTLIAEEENFSRNHYTSSECDFPITPTTPVPCPSLFPLIVPPPPPTPVMLPDEFTDQPAAKIISGPSDYAPNMPTSKQSPPVTLPPRFDATKPPPPIPTSFNQQKRKAVTKAGPSKTMKKERCDTKENVCDNCVRRQIRTELYRENLQKTLLRKEKKAELYRKRCEEYEHRKLMMRTYLQNSDLYDFLEEYLEKDPEYAIKRSDISLLNQLSLATSISQASKPFLEQLFARLLTNGTRSLSSTPSTSNGSSQIIKSLTAFACTRAARSVTQSRKSTAEVFETFLDLMSGRKVPESNFEEIETRVNDIFNRKKVPSTSTRPVVNGFHSRNIILSSRSPSPELQTMSHRNCTSFVPPTASASSSGTVPLVTSPPLTLAPYQPNVPPPNVKMMVPQMLHTIAHNRTNGNVFTPIRLHSPQPIISATTTPQHLPQESGEQNHVPVPLAIFFQSQHFPPVD